MPDIFISYRREDTSGYAGRLYDQVSSHFGRDHVFMDVAALEPGSDFVDTIEKKVATCDALIALIGRNWLTIKDEQNHVRLGTPGDFVSVEIAAALKRNIEVIPVLVGGAKMPVQRELPESLQLLSRRQALEISDVHFMRDVGDLIEALKRPAGTRTFLHDRSNKTVIAMFGAALAIVVSGAVLYQTVSRRHVDPGKETTGITQNQPKTIPAVQLADQKAEVQATTPPVIHLRSEKAILSGDQVQAMLVERGFYSKRENEDGKGIAHRYEARVSQGDVVVADPATALIWQKRGSGDLVPFEGARKYIDGLNAKRFAGFSDWRLPTLEEAMSLMTTDKGGTPDDYMLGADLIHGTMHLDRVFDKNSAPFIWTADAESPSRGWVVYYLDGYPDPERLDFNSYVRAVRSI